MLRLLPALLLLLAATPARAADYSGPLIDVHSHLPGPRVLDAYVEAMAHHGVVKVVLLGVGGEQKDDAVWLAAAARKHPERVIPGLPLADPGDARAADRLDADLTRTAARIVGEVHLRQVGSRKTIDRDPRDPSFGRILEVAARRAVPVVIHYELTEPAAAALEAALARHPKATVILAHAGEGPPERVDGLLARNPNLVVDLSGMHFQRKPALASEAGPLDPRWKALIERRPDRFLMGLDVWAPRLFERAMLDRLFRWTRRILGELRPDVAERVAYRNAAALLRLE